MASHYPSDHAVPVVSENKSKLFILGFQVRIRWQQVSEGLVRRVFTSVTSLIRFSFSAQATVPRELLVSVCTIVAAGDNHKGK